MADSRLKSIIGSLFGFSIQATEEEKLKQNAESFVAPTNEDGALTVEGAGGAYGSYLDLDATAKDEFELITRYREMSLYPEVDSAIDDIVNEAIVKDGQNPPVSLDLSTLDLDESVKDKIIAAFKRVCKLLQWNDQSYDIFRKWYVDGRLYYHIILPENNQEEISGKPTTKKNKKGILELRYIDPRQIRKIRVVERLPDEETNAEIVKVVEEYFLYNQRGIQYRGATMVTPQMSQAIQGVKIKPDSVVYVHSGILDRFSSTVLSNLHKAIKPLNQLKMMEDALVIYRIARAPERRIFYVDVGNLPKTKAEDYLRSLMLKYRNKMVYDVNTGEVRDDRRHLTMLEDFWLPRKDGSTGTEIDTLPGGQNLGEMEDVEYFQKKLYKALNVPVSRLDPDSGFVLGRAQEIARDEMKFSNMIDRFRDRFNHLFKKLLEIELVLTGVMSKDDWQEYQDDIVFKYIKNNYYAEIQENEILKGRIEVLQMLDPDAINYTRKYYSVEWIRKFILRQTEDDQAELDKQIKKEESKYEHLLPQPEEEEPTNFDNFNLDSSKPKPTKPKKNDKSKVGKE